MSPLIFGWVFDQWTAFRTKMNAADRTLHGAVPRILSFLASPQALPGNKGDRPAAFTFNSQIRLGAIPLSPGCHGSGFRPRPPASIWIADTVSLGEFGGGWFSPPANPRASSPAAIHRGRCSYALVSFLIFQQIKKLL